MSAERTLNEKLETVSEWLKMAEQAASWPTTLNCVSKARNELAYISLEAKATDSKLDEAIAKVGVLGRRPLEEQTEINTDYWIPREDALKILRDLKSERQERERK